jgi:hypothetical protein
MPLLTEREFVLPCGFLDDEGTLHREGVMRMATAADEILPLREATVQKNPAYLSIIVLSRVVTRLGGLRLVTPNTIERLFAVDVAHLQDLYNDMNGGADGDRIPVHCPNCAHEFEVAKPSLGGS